MKNLRKYFTMDYLVKICKRIWIIAGIITIMYLALELTGVKNELAIEKRNRYLSEKEYCEQIESLQNQENSIDCEKSLYIQSLENQVEALQLNLERERSYNESYEVEAEPSSADSGFRSYMPYTAITDKGSAQWRIVRSATANENGLMCIDGIPLVAVGTGWGVGLCDVIEVTTDKGTYRVAVGDIKDDRHTDSTNKYTTSNGCAVEFIVDTNSLPSSVARSGNIATLSQYSGLILSIEKIGSI